MNSYTHILTAAPSFIEGMGRLLDFGDTMTEYNSCPSTVLADELATRADWATVGNDIRASMAQFAAEMDQHKQEVHEARQFTNV